MKRWLNAMAALLLIPAALAFGQDPPLSYIRGDTTVILGEDGLPIDAPAAQTGPIRRCLHKHGVACFHRLDWFGCGSFRSTREFIFGSCRTYFQEPCAPKPPRDEQEGILGRNRCASCEQ